MTPVISTSSMFQRYEAETLHGLERFVIEELTACSSVSQVKASGAGRISFQAATTAPLLSLRRATSVYQVLGFDVPRPKALLGHQYFTAISTAIQAIMRSDRSAFSTLSLDAAGSDSSVMLRLIQELALQTGLSVSPDKVDLHLRIRRDPAGTGWEVLIRLTPRPLATRAWRVANFPGALSAPAASVMASLVRLRDGMCVVNLCSGSGTLLIEAGLLGYDVSLFGVEIEPDVMDSAQRNLNAAGLGGSVTLIHGDVMNLPLAGSSVDALLADLPFGQHVGSHQENTVLYPALLAEAARVARPGAHFALLTHEKRLIERVLRANEAWQVKQEVEINLNGLHPRMLLLRRTD